MLNYRHYVCLTAQASQELNIIEKSEDFVNPFKEEAEIKVSKIYQAQTLSLLHLLKANLNCSHIPAPIYKLCHFVALRISERWTEEEESKEEREGTQAVKEDWVINEIKWSTCTNTDSVYNFHVYFKKYVHILC